MNEEQLAKFVKTIENIPYHQFIGLKICSYNPGSCETRLEISENIMNPFGVVHGGIYYTVCDATAFIAASTLLADGSTAVTSDINVSVLAAASAGILRVRANVLKAGKRICFIDARIFDQDENIIAVARVTKTIINYPDMT